MTKKHFATRLIGAAATLSLVAAACGSDEAAEPAVTEEAAAPDEAADGAEPAGDVASGVAEAIELVAAASEPVTFAAPEGVGEIDLAGLAGKKVAIVSLVQAVPILLQWEEEMTEAFEGSGIELTSFDGKFDPNEWGRGIEQAIADNADLIFLLGVPPTAVAPQIAAAEAAGIPIMTSLQGTPGKTVGDVPELTADVGFDYRIPGEMIAQWFVADSEGTGNALILSSDDNTSSPDVWGAMEAEIDRLCPDCTYTREDSTVAEWSDGTLQARTRSLMQADPSVTHILAVFDAMTLAIEPALVELGVEDTVRVAGFNGTPAVMANVQAGTAVKMDVGNPNMWFSAGAVDSVFSVLLGGEPIEDAGVPFRIFTEENMGDIDTSVEDPVDWYGIDPLAEYRSLWGIEG
jgi:ribose transport system substrate-binding protein